jgi:DnaJ-class molecular chaperone
MPLCARCNGKGLIYCPRCDGRKVQVEDQLELIKVAGRSPLPCPACKGVGMVTCPECEGSGTVDDEDD